MRSIGEIESEVERVLVKLRPYLNEDGGDVHFVRFEEETRVLELRLSGNCRGCPLSLMTLRGGIERHILNEIPEIRRVEPV
jgi:Fe-S cluster biogenesis protein NfuA